MSDEAVQPSLGEAVVAIFTEVIGQVPPRGLGTLPEDVVEWTSLAHVRLVHGIEQSLGCELPDRFLGVGPSLAELARAAAATGATA